MVNRLSKKDKNPDQTEIELIREYKVVKANDLIQKARFNLTAQEQKIVLYLVSRIKPNDEEFEWQIFSIKEFCEICGSDHKNGANYKYIKNALKNLRGKLWWITLPNGRETTASWIDDPEIDPKTKQIMIRMNKNLKPYLIKLHEKFTQYALIYTLAMKSQYSIRLYEILKSYEWQQKKEFDIDELKTALDAEKYKRYPDFKRYVLDIAEKEINKFTDINIKIKSEKVGRQYKRIIFSISKRTVDDSKTAGKLEAYKEIHKKIEPEKAEEYSEILDVFKTV